MHQTVYENHKSLPKKKFFMSYIYLIFGLIPSVWINRTENKVYDSSKVHI